MDEDKKKPDFKTDYKIARLSGLGILGFIIGSIIIFYPDLFSKERSIFHEIEYKPRELAAITIEHPRDSVKKIIDAKKDSIRVYDSLISLNAKDDASIARKKTLLNENSKDSPVVKLLNAHIAYYKDASDTDSTAFSKLNNDFHFKIDNDTINKWNENFEKKGYQWKDSVAYYFKDSSVPLSVKGKTIFTIKKYKSDISFVTKYPSAGVWLLLILVFCSFSVIAISTCIYLKNKIITLFNDNSITGLSGLDYYLVCFFTLLSFLALLGILNLSFNDEEVIKDIYFVRTINSSLFWVRIIGYLAGSFCLAGFIHTAAMLGYFAKPLKQLAQIIKQQRAILRDTGNTGSAAVQAQVTLQDTLDQQNEKKIIYDQLLNIFQTYFILSAVILSLMVLCTGGLYNAINSLDFMKLVADDWGYSPVRPDFIYLYGGLHTIILLLVYIPAKLRFTEINIEGSAVVPAEGKWYDFLKNPFTHLKDVLIVASPLLASLVQSLLDLLFK